ncbi:hypothetical protein [Phocaeicola sp.]|uniref:hypothetical protein n=1 Tax=Phocaeicola sp. TaxID=2773926 RepID=UPI003AAF8467
MDKKLPEKLCFNNAYLSLPSEWDASISQLEIMQKIAYNINQIIQFLTDLETNYKNYTDEKVAALKAELLKTLAKTVDDLKAYTDTQDAYYWSEHTKDVKRLETLIAELRAYANDIKLTHEKDVAQLNGKIDETKAYLEQYTDFAVERLKEWVEEQLEKLRLEIDKVNEDGFRIFDPTTGYRDRVGNTVNNVYDVLRVRAITCGQFDAWFPAFDKDCEDFKALHIRAGAFDSESYCKMYGVFDASVNSPASGDALSHARALDEVLQVDAELHLTAQEFDSVMSETCQAIKTKNKDALWWDTENATYYDTYNVGNGLGVRTVGRSAHGFVKVGTVSIPAPDKPTVDTFPYLWIVSVAFSIKSASSNDNEFTTNVLIETNSNIAIGTDQKVFSYRDGVPNRVSYRFFITFSNNSQLDSFSFASIRGKIVSENVLLKELLV